MSGSLRDFEMAIDAFMAEIPEELEKLHKAVTMQVLAGVVQKTPVDTGRARGNWIVSLADAVVETREEPIEAGLVMAQAAMTISHIKPFSLSIVQNNLPYIVQLEDGSSKQAPNGMVAVTIAEIDSQLGD